MKEDNIEFCLQLVRNYSTKNGMIELIKKEDAFQKVAVNNKMKALTIPLTYRRLELIAFINSKIKLAIEKEEYISANNLTQIKRFYLTKHLLIYISDFGFSLMTPNFFKDYFISTINLLGEFEENLITDKENKLLLNYNENQMTELIVIIELLSRDEIFWGWNKHQFRINDILDQLSNGAVFKLENIEMNNENNLFSRIVSISKTKINSTIFIIIEGMAYHEGEIKEFVNALENNLNSLSFKIGVKEVAELEPKINLIYKN